MMVKVRVRATPRGRQRDESGKACGAGRYWLLFTMTPSELLVLGIETSNPSAWVAPCPRPGVAIVRLTMREGVCEGMTTLARGEIDPTAKHDDQLMVAVAGAAREAGITAKQLHRVAVSIGPGGYTAVRIGVVVAKMICEVTGAACHGVPTADGVIEATVSEDSQENAGEPTTGRLVRVLLASKGESAYVATYARGDEGWTQREAGLFPSAAVHWDAQGQPGIVIADRFAPPAMLAGAKAAGCEHRPPVFDASVIAKLSMRYAAVDPQMLAPLYPREPEAVTKWRELHGGQ